MSDTITVRIRESRSGARFDYRSGQIVDLPADQARKWVARGIADLVGDQPAKKAADRSEKTVAPEAKTAEKR